MPPLQTDVQAAAQDCDVVRGCSVITDAAVAYYEDEDDTTDVEKFEDLANDVRTNIADTTH